MSPLIDRLVDRLEKCFNEADTFYQQEINELFHASSLSDEDHIILHILLHIKKDYPAFTFDHIWCVY